MPSVQVNGEVRETAAEMLGQLLSDMGIGAAAAGIAVAVNGAVVPRTDWPQHRLHVGDRIEVVGAVQGG